MKERSTTIFIIIFTAVILCAFIAVGCYMIFKDVGYVNVEGTIIDIREHESDESHELSTYSPIVEFVYEGTTYISSPSVSSSDINYSVGDRITIRVNPDNPEQIAAATERNIGYAIIIFITFISLMVLSFSVIVPRLKAKHYEYNWGGMTLAVVFIVFPFLVLITTYLFSGASSLIAYINQKPFITVFFTFSAFGLIGFIYELIRSLKTLILNKRCAKILAELAVEDEEDTIYDFIDDGYSDE